LFAPIVNVTVNEPVAVVVEPDTAFTAVGAAGEPTTTGNDAAAGPPPRAFVALTRQIYVLPVVTPVSVIGAAVAPACVPIFVAPPLVEVHVAVWLVIALPLFAPIVNVTVNEPVAVVVELDTAFTFVGAAGEPTITESDGVEAALAPIALVALTVQAYVLAVVTADTVIGAAAAPMWTPVFVTPPLLDTHVAVWLVIALPLSAPIVNVTVNDPVTVVVEPDTVLTAVGGPGTFATVTAFDATDGGPVPEAVVAVTMHV
jgi:hypothetical protein